MYEIIDAFDPAMPSSAKNATPFTAIACHDTEGGTGRAGARGTITFLKSTASTRNASYHEIIAYETTPTKRFTVFRIVPASRCAHSIAPQPISPDSGLPLYTPDAWVRQILGANWWNPNQGVYAQSIAGHKAEVAAYAADPYFVECMHRRQSELRALLHLQYRAEHFRFNPRTRTDWGNVLMDRLGGLVIPNTLPKDDFDMPKILRPLRGVTVTIAKGAAIRTDPSLGQASFGWNLGTDFGMQPFAVVEGDSSDAGTGKPPTREWYAYVANDNVIRYTHCLNAKSPEVKDTEALTRRLGTAHALFTSIGDAATKGRTV